MTYEEFYGAALPELKLTESELLDMVQAYSATTCQSGQLKPILHADHPGDHRGAEYLLTLESFFA